MSLLDEKTFDAPPKKSSRLELLFQLLKEEKTYRREQICQAIFRSNLQRYSQITTLSKRLRDSIISSLGDEILTIKPSKTQEVDQATKYLFELQDASRIEAVRMEFKNEHTSLCISSQVGCLCACSFCTTGRISYLRNLTSDEIIDQPLFFVKNNLDIRNVAFMGMGEPFLNPHLFEALRLLTDPQYMGFSPRRLTLSTVGIIEGMNRLTQEFPQISLTLSLHSPFNEERNLLVPYNKKYPIEELFDSLEEHLLKTNKKTYIAYLVLSGKNDSLDHVNKLTSLLERKNLKHLYLVNLIRFNPSPQEDTPFPKTKKESLSFLKEELEARGVLVTIRQSFGSEIQAACGQLAAEYEKRKFL
jgi:23S rRNA (adenine-C8)-methyltransferase